MFVHFDEQRCPSCGTEGKVMHEEPMAFVCPMCSTSFGKFGVIFMPHAHEDRECN